MANGYTRHSLVSRRHYQARYSGGWKMPEMPEKKGILYFMTCQKSASPLIPRPPGKGLFGTVMDAVLLVRRGTVRYDEK